MINSSTFLNAYWHQGWQAPSTRVTMLCKLAFRALRSGNCRRAEKLMLSHETTRAIWAAANK